MAITTTTTTSYQPLSHRQSSSSLVNSSATGLARIGSNTHGRRASSYASSHSHTSLTRPQIPRMHSSSSVNRHGSAKLHKRSDSVSSRMGPPALTRMPSPVRDEYTLGHQSQPSLKSGPTNKIKPYLRKMSLRDDGEDQGKLDLSQPSAENDALAGLGLRDFSNASRSVSDVTFQPAVRRTSSTHTRAISGASQMSTVSAPLRPTQPFVHPMRQRPYTPPSAISYSPTHPEEEAEESTDVVTNEMRHSDTHDSWRQHRSTSTSSYPRRLSTEMAHNHSTASLTRLANVSESNVSTKSDKEKHGRPRRNTDRSFDATSPSSRTSFDKAVSFLSRASEQQEEGPASRAASIRAARRAFEEKEAAKDRKLAKEQSKRRDTEEKQRAKKEDKQRRKSEASDRTRHRRSRSDSGNAAVINEKMPGKEYSDFAPVHNRSLPVQGDFTAPPAPTRANTDLSKTKVAKGGWMRFMAWTRTRLLSCGA